MLAVSPGEELLNLAAAVERATGRRPHPTTCHRWRLRGSNGVRLPTVKVGGRRLTSVEAVLRWVAACNEGEDQGFSRVPTARLERDIADAEAFLEAEGL